MATLADTNSEPLARSRSDFASMRDASLVLNTRALVQNNYLIVFCGVLIGALVYQQIHYTRLLDRATFEHYGRPNVRNRRSPRATGELV